MENINFKAQILFFFFTFPHLQLLRENTYSSSEKSSCNYTKFTVE